MHRNEHRSVLNNNLFMPWLTLLQPPPEGEERAAQPPAISQQPLQAGEQWINGLLNMQESWGHQYADYLRSAGHNGALEPLGNQVDRLVDSWVDWRRQCWRCYFDNAEQMTRPLGREPASNARSAEPAKRAAGKTKARNGA